MTKFDFLIKTVFIFGYDSLIFISANKFNQEQFKYLNVRMSKIEDRNKIGRNNLKNHYYEVIST